MGIEVLSGGFFLEIGFTGSAAKEKGRPLRDGLIFILKTDYYL